MQTQAEGREARDRDDEIVGAITETRPDRVVLDVPKVGRLEIPPGDVVALDDRGATLRHPAAWYRRLGADSPALRAPQDTEPEDTNETEKERP